MMLKNPDFIVGGKNNPYLLRWYITPWSGWWRVDKEGKPRTVDSLNLLQRMIRTLPNVYLHKFLRDDDDRALHDHPWASMSIILRGGYIEHTPEGQYYRKPFRIYTRSSTASHRVELYEDVTYRNRSPREIMAGIIHPLLFTKKRPAWTIFITGFKIREWGFHCPKGWVHWTIFTSSTDSGSVGKGCGEQ